jgi:hypothetical protein
MPLHTNTSLPFDTNTMLVLAVLGVALKLFMSGNTTDDGSSGPASATVWGYGLTTLSFLGLLLIIVALSSQESMSMSVMEVLKSVMKNSFPVIATIVILGWITIINLIYMKRINQGKVASEYNQFSFISTILIFLQLLVVFKYILGKLNIQTVSSSNPTVAKMNQLFTSELSSITIILSLLNLIFAAMMQIVVEFFSTDG